MDPIPSDTTRSLRRSRLRARLLLTISSLGEAYAGQLAKHTGIPVTRVRWILHGRPPYYREDLSLIQQGLVEERTTRSGRVYSITAKGRRKARSVLAHRARRAELRAFRRARGQMQSHLTSSVESDAGSPDSTWHVSWRVT